MFVLAGFIYFYPVVKYSKMKLDCQTVAKKYILENKNTDKLNTKQLRMLSTNFCNGGNEIYEIENLKDWSNYLISKKDLQTTIIL